MNRSQAISAALYIRTEFFPSYPAVRDPEGRSLEHLSWMVDEIAKEKMSEDKTMRWLGYIQGVLVVKGLATLEQMKQVVFFYPPLKVEDFGDSSQ